jgi:hypothetical protein
MKAPLLFGGLLMATMSLGQQLYVEDFEGYAAGDYVTTDNPLVDDLDEQPRHR